MLGGFYKTNNQVLKFKIGKDSGKIIFNQYLMQRENFQRLSGELPRGKFYITARNIADDLNFSKDKAQRLLKEFVRIKIIELIRVGGKDRSPSIYSYITAKGDTVPINVSDTQNKTVKLKNISLSECICDTAKKTVSDTSKKENLKRELNKNLNIEEEDDAQNYDFKLLCKAYKDANGFVTLGSKIELRKLLKFYSNDLIIKAIETMILRANKPNLQYVITTLNDWNSRGLTTLKDVNEAINEHEAINNRAKQNKLKKTKAVAAGTNNYSKINKGSFNDYKQRNYDFEELEKKLLGW